MRGSAWDHRRQLAERLRGRSGELEEAIIDRLCALEDSLSDHHQRRRLKELIRPVVKHGLIAVELGEHRSPEPPPAVAAHARKAAWRPVPLETLLEHYFAGYSVFKQFLLRESRSVELACEVQTSLDVVFHRLGRAVTDEHKRELQKRNRSSDLRRLERVKGLLSGELLDAPDLGYPFDGTHVGIVASGPDISSTVRRLFQSTGSNLLLVPPAPNRVWAWINSRQELSAACAAEPLTTDLPPNVCISLGEPREGLSGWRLTHLQALSARSVAVRRRTLTAQFSKDALVAAALQNELLRSSLTRQYLDPLGLSRDNGKAFRETLRAYFSTDRHISSAATLLGVKRHTVTNRLRVMEERLGRRIDSCAAELELVLRLEDLK